MEKLPQMALQPLGLGSLDSAGKPHFKSTKFFSTDYDGFDTIGTVMVKK